jgi:valyl-tRNA synthetase
MLCGYVYIYHQIHSGAVKITPAHDPNDYELGQRHSLPILNILNDDGTINNVCAQFTGLKRFDARVAVLEALKEAGFYRGTENNTMTIPICRLLQSHLNALYHIRLCVL